MHDKMVLGENLVYPMDCKKTQINNNLLGVGTTGCGKTMSVTEPNLLATKNIISLLSALIGYVHMVKKNSSMLDVLKLFYDMEMERDGEGIMTTIDVLFETLEKKRPHSFAGRMWKAFHVCPYRTASCVVSSLSAALDMIYYLTENIRVYIVAWKKNGRLCEAADRGILCIHRLNQVMELH